ncbi:MAG TPA: GNAT family N-acetyltransferase [Croceibacterium sp.]|nr:GNAT family N-acetyltransferase [Croceibacterium sp.]
MPEDAPALAALAAEAFVAAFGHLYRHEDLAAFLTEERTVEGYREHLHDPRTRIALAENAGELAGYALIHWPSDFASESDASRPLALHQLYCAPAATGRGIGATLMEWALAEARALDCDAVQLSVYSENFAAQRFYARYGFSKIADIGFMVGTQRDAEFLLELKL